MQSTGPFPNSEMICAALPAANVYSGSAAGRERFERDCDAAHHLTVSKPLTPPAGRCIFALHFFRHLRLIRKREKTHFSKGESYEEYGEVFRRSLADPRVRMRGRVGAGNGADQRNCYGSEWSTFAWCGSKPDADCHGSDAQCGQQRDRILCIAQ